MDNSAMCTVTYLKRKISYNKPCVLLHRKAHRMLLAYSSTFNKTDEATRAKFT